VGNDKSLQPIHTGLHASAQTQGVSGDETTMPLIDVARSGHSLFSESFLRISRQLTHEETAATGCQEAVICAPVISGGVVPAFLLRSSSTIK